LGACERILDTTLFAVAVSPDWRALSTESRALAMGLEPFLDAPEERLFKESR
jgi:hypothetical protein